MKNKLLIFGMAGIAVSMLFAGCAGARRGIPSAGVVINANMDRNDYEVLGTASGKSSVTYICGAIQYIDGNKLSIFGINCFEDQYAFEQKKPTLLQMLFPALFIFDQIMVSPEDRACYKALAGTPDADAIVEKSYIRTKTGLPPLWGTKEVTYTGKAIQYKVHN
jgi:hypothetical protein